MSAFDLYIILKLDNIIAFFGVTAMCFFGFSIVNLIIWGVNSDATHTNWNSEIIAKNCKKRAYTSFPIAVLLFLIAIVLPSTKEMAIIKVVPIIAKSEALHKVTGDAKELYDLGIEAAKGCLKNITEKKK